VNKQSFKAVGTGKMKIDIPNSIDILQLSLTEVLYSPEVRYTLMSVGCLDDKGFLLTFAGGKCTIRGLDSMLVSEVPKNSNGLYKVAHEKDEANAATEVLTLDQFHCRMGHISLEVAWKLVDKGFVTGMRLETMPMVDPCFCESCVYVKVTCKPVTKAWEEECATEFGGEIHSDLWDQHPLL
jgi:hypothetical protein